MFVLLKRNGLSNSLLSQQVDCGFLHFTNIIFNISNFDEYKNG